MRLRVARLPAAATPRGSIGAGGRSLRLVGVGDSTIEGIGTADQREALLGQVAAAVAARTSRSVEWLALGRSGVTAGDVLRDLLPRAVAARPDLVVLSVGTNDAVQGRPPAAFKADLEAIVAGLCARRDAPAVVFAGLPPMRQFPALPWPLADLLGARAERLQQAAVSLAGYRGLKVVVFPARLDRAGYADDGFHPGPEGCAQWARWVVDGFALALGSAASQAPEE